MAQNHARTDKSDTETEVRGEVGRAQSPHSQYKKGHMKNIYQTNLDEEAIVDL